MALSGKRIVEVVALLERGENEQAAKLSRSLLLQRPNTPDALHLLAVASYRLGDAHSAVRYSERAVKLRPDSADYAGNLGHYYLSLGRLDDAARELRRAAEIDPAHAAIQVNLAQLLKAQGQSERAIEQLRGFVEAHPETSSGVSQLGVMLADSGKHEEALIWFRRGLALDPNSVEANANIGGSLRALHRPAEALPFYIAALDLDPRNADVMAALGATMQSLGQLGDAEQWFCAALSQQPSHFVARSNLALLRAAQGRFLDAAEMLEKLATEHPSSYETWNNLGNSLLELARYDDALAAFERAVTLEPSFYQAYANMGNVHRRRGQLDEALANCDRALSTNPTFPEGLNNKGVILLGMGRLDEAARCFEQAVQARSGFADPLINLANVWRERGHLHKAVTVLREAFDYAPGNAGIANNLGCAFGDLGQVPEALHCYRQALQLDPNYTHAHSNILLNLHYLPGVPPREIWREHKEFAARHEPAVAALRRPHTMSADPDRLLRIGYVSSDFRRHSVAFFLEPVLERHDRAQYVPYCYSSVLRPDAVTHRFQELVGAGWREVTGLSDEQFADQVRLDGIDILIDLGGHTGNTRVLSFAAKPAPVQVTWLGYPDTTGLTAMDYRITDKIADPPGQTDQWHSETLARLDRPFVCYRPAPGTPDVTPSPVVTGKPFTFGSFNAMSKISSETVLLWSRILLQVPGSRLALKNKGLHEPESRNALYARFAQHGIGPERLVLEGQRPSLEAHLAFYGTVDLALDTFPYHGTTTTCEALWMGVPVVCLAGATHVSRVGCSLLGAAGLSDFIAATAEEYVELAARLALHWPEWAADRTSLRDRLRRSPLMDEQGFVPEIEAAYRAMWRHWCAEGERK